MKPKIVTTMRIQLMPIVTVVVIPVVVVVVIKKYPIVIKSKYCRLNLTNPIKIRQNRARLSLRRKATTSIFYQVLK